MRALFLVLSLLVLVPGCRREAPPAQAKSERFHCPMHPGYVSDRPGDCPICGMKLVPMKERGSTPLGPTPAGFGPITIDPGQRQLIGLRTATVTRAPLSGQLRAIGRITYDETRIHHVHARYEAYVERLYANFTGKYVRKGEPLLSLYSPDLLAAQQEYLLSLRGQKGGPAVGVDLAAAAKKKLLLWNVTEADIEALSRTEAPKDTFNLYAPISGYVIEKTAVHGARIRPEDSLFDIVDLSRVWVLLDIYEQELPRVAKGQEGVMTLSYWPGRSWTGKVTYIYPSVDPKTRTIKLRLEVDNARGELKAEMFADVVLEVAPRNVLAIPEDAVVETGTRRIVFSVLPGGHLLPREIQIGDRAAGVVEVRSGLTEGEKVAAGASFLLDSESRLQAALSAMAPPGPDAGPPKGPPPGHVHGGPK